MLMTRPKPSVELQLVDRDWTPLAETLNRGARLVSRKVGLIRRIRAGMRRPQDPVIHSLNGELTDLSRYSDLRNPPLSSGSGETVEAALAAAIGEAVERYCMNFCDPGKLVLATARELGDDAVDPGLVRLYSREQCESGRLPKGTGYFDHDTRIRWVWGYSLSSHWPRLVPASLVYIDPRTVGDERYIGHNTSTGLAAGASLEEAVLSGLMEVVERDAFALSWLLKRPGRRLRIDDEGLELFLERRFHTHSPLVDLRFFELSIDVPIPVVLGFMRRPSDFGPTLTVGAAARLEPRSAVKKSLYEIGQMFPYLRYLVRTDWQPEADFSNVKNFELHGLFYLRRPDLVDEAFGFLEQAPSEVAFSELENRSTGRVLGDIEFCLRALEALGHEVIVVDLTTPDIRDLGMRAVRVVVPGLVSLHGDSVPFLGPARVLEKAREAGIGPAELHPYPHPFP